MEGPESPIEMARNKLRQHWDGVFAQEASAEPDEWFVPFEQLEPLFEGRGKLKVLVAGCGRSRLGVELSRRGHWVVNLDLSGVVIEQMRARHPECGEWVVGDVTNLTGLIAENAFDAVVDKGTSDTLSFRVSTKLKEMRTVMLRSFLAESYRVLRPGGRLLIITTRNRIKVSA
jgi:SAM-dependent methyltransferase